MKFIDLLGDDGVLTPLDASDLEGVLVAALQTADDLTTERASRIAIDLSNRVVGDVVRVHDDVVVVLAQEGTLKSVGAVLSVTRGPFEVPEIGDTDPSSARVVILLVTPRRFSTLKHQMLPALVRFFREEERAAALVAALSAAEIRGLRGLMDLELHERLLVEDVLSPAKYRVYPETPYTEVVDLMVRRGLTSVPVVGEDYEFLGIVTIGDAMKHVVTKTQNEEAGDSAGQGPVEEATAREIMTRSVMCVSEDQSLMEAAFIMVNRDVEELPVIREGEMVGLLTRGEVLRLLFRPAEN
jgi:CBS domain-containing protein